MGSGLSLREPRNDRLKITPARSEVGDQVVGVLDADREAHQAVADAERGAHARPGSSAWVMIAGCSIRLSTPPRLSASVNSCAALEEALRAGEAAVEHDRDHAAEAVHLALARARAADATGRPG